MHATRRQFLASGAALTQSGRRPNILFLMTDQHRFDCLGANGNVLIRTPNLDRLAARSANFQNAFVQAPVCVPSRVSFFTGRYPHSHRNRVNYTPADPREVFLQRVLQDAGYQTGSVGKLHLHPPTKEHARSTGFDRVFLDDGVSKTDPYSDYVKWREAHDPQARLPYNQTAPATPGGNPFRGAIRYRYTPTAWTGDRTLELLKEFAADPRPFFLYASFFKPHSPHTVPEPYHAMFDNVEIPLPRRVTLDYIRTLPLPVQKQILRGRPQYDMDRARLQWIYRSYYGAVAMADYEIGRILDTLEQSGKADNTIIVFSTDHGDQLLEHGLEGKNVFFEHSVHIPLLVAYPGHVRPGKVQELVETVDVVPTLLEWAGIAAPKGVQGRSLAPLLAGLAYEARSAVFAENIIPEVITSGQLKFEYAPGEGVGGIRHPDAKMARTQRWKFNYYPGGDGELYDLAEDPGEWRNLYHDAAHRAVRDEMRQRILDWMITADEAEQIAPRWLL
jgi:arylsulfatase A-like enzyme